MLLIKLIRIKIMNMVRYKCLIKKWFISDLILKILTSKWAKINKNLCHSLTTNKVCLLKVTVFFNFMKIKNLNNNLSVNNNLLSLFKMPLMKDSIIIIMNFMEWVNWRGLMDLIIMDSGKMDLGMESVSIT
jgi:hypothetical protein